MKRRPVFWREALDDRQRRYNAMALTRFLVFAVVIVTVYAALFQLLMWWLEGERHSWLVGVYWTLSTMTTLGLGDIVFESTVGRLYTAFVLMSGIVLFLVVLPFAFIRFFYSPWLEARRVPERISGHVIVVRSDNFAPALFDRLDVNRIPYFVLEQEPARASELRRLGISVIAGAADDRSTYERLRVQRAGLVVANGEDTVNASVTLTVRELAPEVPIVAYLENAASIDILELAGATHALALKQQLGEQLANRLNAGHAQTHEIGSFHDAVIAEVPVHNTPFVGRSLRDIALREHAAVNVVGVLEQARFRPASPDTILTEHSVPVVIGSREAMQTLDEMLMIYDTNNNPVVVIGGGKVGCAAARKLKRKGLGVNMIERDERLRDQIGDLADGLLVGDAAERDVLLSAGLEETPGVLITTNDDAMNIYLALYCRRLAGNVRVLSRITHERNLDAIRRAGADFALSHNSLGVESVLALLHHRPQVVFGQGVELFEVAVPSSLSGRTLGEAGIPGRTGLNVIAVEHDAEVNTNPVAATRLPEAATLMMVGEPEQLQRFRDQY